MPVLGGLDSLAYVAQHHGVRRVVIATKKLAPDVVRAIQVFAEAHHLELLELDIRVRPVRTNGDGKPASGPVAAEAVGVRSIARVAAGAS